METIKKIGILTSGGDCAGLNFAIGAVVKKAVLDYQCEVFGIYHSTSGLMERPIHYKQLYPADFGIDLSTKGGTFLGTVNKGNPFSFNMPDGSVKDRSQEIIEGYKNLGLDALIAIGGDGSMRIIEKLTSLGNIKFMGIPKTVDNDVAFTNYAIGFMTALETATKCIKDLHDTAFSHRRIMVIEVMGREVGHIALNAGIAGLADVILLPEIPYDINKVNSALEKAYKAKDYAIVVCSEAASPVGGSASTIVTADQVTKFAGAGERVAAEIFQATGLETRVAVLGHIQRGGSPVAFDAVLAASMGTRAVELLFEGKNRRLVGIDSGNLVDIPLEDVASTQRAVALDDHLVATARGLGICMGD